MADAFWCVVVCLCVVKVVSVDIGSLHLVHDVESGVKFVVYLVGLFVWLALCVV